MNTKEGQGFSRFVVYALRVIFSLIAAGTVIKLGYYLKYQKLSLSLGIIAVYVLGIFLMIYGLRKRVDRKVMLCIILITGLILRIIWCASVKSIPVSDYKTIFNSAKHVLNGEYWIFKDYSYFARFPHLIIFVLYCAGIIKVFGASALTAMKTVNIFLSIISIILVYKIAKEIFKDEKRSLIAAFMSALFPASILYTAVYCTENIAIPFYLASLYYFIVVINKKKRDEYLLLSGILLLIGHLFRATAQVMVVAYILYIIVYLGRQHKRKVKSVMYILVSFIIPFMILGYSLIGTGITDTKLWSGKEPAVTSILKGSHLESFGRWNAEDAHFIEENIKDTEYIKEESKKKIAERYTSSPAVLAKFAVNKVARQWWQGDFAGAFWAESGLTDENIGIDILNNGSVWFQLFYTVIFIMVLVGVFKNKEYLNNKIINILYIIFCGYGLLFLILESQERYGFVISWVFILLSLTAVNPGSE